MIEYIINKIISLKPVAGDIFLIESENEICEKDMEILKEYAKNMNIITFSKKIEPKVTKITQNSPNSLLYYERSGKLKEKNK